jgi:hypothetical protein
MSHHLHDRTSGIRPTAEQLVEGDQYSVLLDLEPVAGQILTDLTQALRRRGHLLTLLANCSPTSVDHTKLLHRILGETGVRDAFHVLIHADAAEELSAELFDAKDEPEHCLRSDCPNYAVDRGLCPGHADDVDRVVNLR